MISVIPKSLFAKNLMNLKKLNISNNNLTELELWQFNLSIIEEIDLRKNFIDKFSNKFQWLYNGHSNLSSLPAEYVKIYFEPQMNKTLVFDDSTMKKYNICDSNQFEIVFNAYFKAFLESK